MASPAEAGKQAGGCLQQCEPCMRHSSGRADVVQSDSQRCSALQLLDDEGTQQLNQPPRVKQELPERRTTASALHQGSIQCASRAFVQTKQGIDCALLFGQIKMGSAW